MPETTNGQRRTVCLAMIVRDAAPFVAETLACVAPYVDRWVIIDTGSVDDTPRVIQEFFAQAGIPGRLEHREWHGFAHNRTEVLAECRGEADYALMIDADDLIEGHLPLEDLTADCYRVKFGPDFVYWRCALFSLERQWEYRGAVHEYPICVDGGERTENLEGDYNFVFRSLGGRAHDPQRFRRDADALLRSWDEDGPDGRTAFYLGQSLRDLGELEEAIEWYAQSAEITTWNEEAYVALLEVARCAERLHADPDDDEVEFIVTAYEDAASRRPQRAEAFHDLAAFHRQRGEWAEAYLAARRGGIIPEPVDDLLFVQADMYRWRIHDERAVAASWLGFHEEAVEICDELLMGADLPLDQRDRVLFNRAFSLHQLASARRVPYSSEAVAKVAHRVRAVEPRVTLTITTCRRRELFERTIDSFLARCTDAHLIDRWICIDDGSDDDDRRAMAERYPFFEFIWNDPANAGHVHAMNRLLDEVHSEYWLHLEDDWEFLSPLPLVELATRILDDDSSLLQVVVNRNYGETLDDHELIGGVMRRTTGHGLAYRVHEHLSGDALDALFDSRPGSLSNAYWPGFSLMPSLMRTSAMHRVGRFDPAAGHFEMDFAERAEAAGLHTAFIDAITCVTTGPLRGSRRIDDTPNAYELAGRQQFEPMRAPRPSLDLSDMDVRIINLDRRPDRYATCLENWTEELGSDVVSRWQRFAAIDGNDVVLTDEIDHMFRGSERPLRRAQTACAISHLALWWEVATGSGRPMLILEDDARPVGGFLDNFAEVTASMLERNVDVAFLGLSYNRPAPTADTQTLTRIDHDGLFGGMFGYVITQRGARLLWEIARRDGISYGIDTFALLQEREVVMAQAVPALVTTPVALPDGPEIDSDIQYDPARL